MEKFEESIQKFVHVFPKRPVEGNLDYVTDASYPIQAGIHEPKEDRVSRMHLHKFFSEFFYIEKGYITVTFTDSTFKQKVVKTFNEGDMFIMYPGIGHSVFLPKGCRVIEFHQGPYVDDKLFEPDVI